MEAQKSLTLSFKAAGITHLSLQHHVLAIEPVQ
jgi:hypothetical protein